MRLRTKVWDGGSGQEFAKNSASVLQWLAVGVFINSLAQVFTTLVQGSGRPDLSAKLHVLELPTYLVGLWLAIHYYGILGAAIAWTVRVSVDGAMLLWISRRFLGDDAGLLRRLTAALCLAIGVLMVPMLAGSLEARAAPVGATALIFVPTSWFYVLAADERALIFAQLRRLRIH